MVNICIRYLLRYPGCKISNDKLPKVDLQSPLEKINKKCCCKLAPSIQMAKPRIIVVVKFICQTTVDPPFVYNQLHFKSKLHSKYENYINMHITNVYLVHQDT